MFDFNEINDAFDFDDDAFADFGMEDAFDTRYIKPPKPREIPEHLLKYSDAQKLAKDINITRQNERYFVLVNGSFIFGDFIEAFITGHDLQLAELTISTLSLSQNNIDSLANLMRGGYVDNLSLILSAYQYSHERNGLIPYIYEQLDKPFPDSFYMAAAGTHCKVALLHVIEPKPLYIVIHGSANLRSSSNLEQFMIEENEALYDFNYEYQARIIDKYATINKPIRNQKLWNIIKD